MAIQELDLKISHRSGLCNANADALSRSPLAASGPESGPLEGVVAAVSVEESDLSALQWKDEHLACIIAYLERGILPNVVQPYSDLHVSQEDGKGRTRLGPAPAICAVCLSGKSATVDSRVVILLTLWPRSETPGGGSHESGADKEAGGFEGIWLWVGK